MVVQEAISRTCFIISILISVPTVYLLNIYQYFTTLFAFSVSYTCPNGNIFGTLLPSPDFTLRKLERFSIKVSCNKWVSLLRCLRYEYPSYQTFT